MTSEPDEDGMMALAEELLLPWYRWHRARRQKQLSFDDDAMRWAVGDEDQFRFLIRHHRNTVLRVLHEINRATDEEIAREAMGDPERQDLNDQRDQQLDLLFNTLLAHCYSPAPDPADDRERRDYIERALREGRIMQLGPVP